MIVLSHYQVKPIFEARGKLHSVVTSPDLGISKVEVQLDESVLFPGEGPISWKVAGEILENKNNCFLVNNGNANAIKEFSSVFNRIYTLYPTESAPTMLISGIPMHRIKDTNPWLDSKVKMDAFGQVGGHVLDTATGLGYTAILAADNADRVTTIELDPTAQKIALENPWSQKLFNHPRIHQLIGDSAVIIETLGDDTHSGIIHDPPMMSMAGDLYSLVFYKEAFRVLKPNGRMFHYIGNPESNSGRKITRGVIDRLRHAGFPRVKQVPEAFGVMASKMRKIA